MPIHDRAYLRMEDRGIRSRAPTFLAISRYGARYTRRTKLFWLFVIGAWIPAFVWVVTIYTAEETGHLSRDVPLEWLATTARDQYRIFAADMTMTFLQLQAVMVTFMAALTGGGAIAEDSRRSAFEIYFSRPIGWMTYALGKWTFVFARLLLVLLYPMLFVYVVAFAFLPNFFTHCWPVTLSAAAAALFMAACYAVVVLGVSSTVRSTRYSIVFWFILAFFTTALSLILAQMTGDARFETTSFRFAIEHVAARIMGANLAAIPLVDAADRSVALSAAALSCWLVLSAWFLVRRVRRAAGA